MADTIGGRSMILLIPFYMLAWLLLLVALALFVATLLQELEAMNRPGFSRHS